jgi:hypothetical protein
MTDDLHGPTRKWRAGPVSCVVMSGDWELYARAIGTQGRVFYILGERQVCQGVVRRRVDPPRGSQKEEGGGEGGGGSSCGA